MATMCACRFPVEGTVQGRGFKVVDTSRCDRLFVKILSKEVFRVL
jgi:hypothetical protein